LRETAETAQRKAEQNAYQLTKQGFDFLAKAAEKNGIDLRGSIIKQLVA